MMTTGRPEDGTAVGMICGAHEMACRKYMLGYASDDVK